MNILSAETTAEQKHQKNLERLRALRPIDDDFMRCMFQDNLPLVQYVLRVITGISDLIVIRCETQKDFKRLGGARSVCLDVYAQDSADRIYDIEIQKAEEDADPRRPRYHMSVSDVEHLDAGRAFSELPETFIIFIMETDYFSAGKAVYPIERVNLATGQIFHDGGHILYVNEKFRDDSEIGKLMHDFCCARADEMKLNIMAERARYLKENPKGVRQMCKILEEMCEESRQEGKADGLQEAAEKTVLRMMKIGGFSIENMAAISGMPLEDVRKIMQRA